MIEINEPIKKEVESIDSKGSLEKGREWYYSQPMVLYNIISQLKNKYLSVRKKNKKYDGIENKKKFILTRYYMGYSIPLLQDSLKRNNVLFDSSAKIYFDLATWKDENGITPIFSFNMKERKEQKKVFSGNPTKNNGRYIQLINSYDFAIDIDCKNIKTAWKEAKKIKEIFDSYRLPYSIRFSGSKGFHFVIDYKWIKTKVKPINRADYFGKIVAKIISDEKLKYVDTSIYDSRRILKIAYSLCNNDGKEYVALPLSDSQFKNFKYEDMELSNVLKTVKFFKRGLLERTHSLGEKELKSNVLMFLKDYK